jgi:hypothetical protein
MRGGLSRGAIRGCGGEGKLERPENNHPVPVLSKGSGKGEGKWTERFTAAMNPDYMLTVIFAKQMQEP